MRIVAGSLRGKPLLAPAGNETRPTADRVRQALFDMLRHADWAEGALDGPVLDAFAGTGALGLEALSRGATRAVFFEHDRAALDCLRANIAACGLEDRTLVVARHVTRLSVAREGWDQAGLVFLDPPYRKGLIEPTIAGLQEAGWIAADALLVAEIAVDEPIPTEVPLLAERKHGAARLCLWRAKS